MYTLDEYFGIAWVIGIPAIIVISCIWALIEIRFSNKDSEDIAIFLSTSIVVSLAWPVFFVVGGILLFAIGIIWFIQTSINLVVSKLMKIFRKDNK